MEAQIRETFFWFCTATIMKKNQLKVFMLHGLFGTTYGVMINYMLWALQIIFNAYADEWNEANFDSL